MKNNPVIYQVFVRNYSKEGTFKALQKDLERIKNLGVDIIYLTPIHKIGVLNRKGTYGSPYAIQDYFSVSEDLGTIQDFKDLVNNIHSHGMKIILDMVFNHTSPDNVLINTHPEYYFYKNDKRGNKVGDWTDIVDLETDRDDVQEYLLSVLKYWVSQGVDGFRFDVASLIPISFFKKLRNYFGKDLFLLAECIDHRFGDYLDSVNQKHCSDKELAPYFDYLYAYDHYHYIIDYFEGKDTLSTLADLINQDAKDNIKRAYFLENHDKRRIFNLVNDKESINELIKLTFDLDGATFIFMGEEYGLTKDVPLFEKDPIDLSIKNDEIASLYEHELKNKNHLISSQFISFDGDLVLNTNIDDKLINKRYKLKSNM